MPARKSSSSPLQITPVQARRTFEVVVHHIREQLASGALKPGDKLPSEKDLAEQLGVGRNAVREALRNLENAGLIEMGLGVKGGAFIREADPGQVTQLMRDMVHTGSLSVDDLTELRIHLMDVVVRLACERATEADFAALKDIVEKTASTVSDPSYDLRLTYSLQFYRILAGATRNRAITMVVESLSDAVGRLLGPTYFSPVELAAARWRFYEHFVRRDADAASRELRSLLEALRDLAKRLEAGQAVPSSA
ncbi:GntR family transcriptional regulator [Hydrogenophaga sp.]|uniref:FadR/GntR family transcriptional regulator n=1 Tax=Hydrogenophaga sp. TaxID=1904254 RepID=UPI0026231D6E|nr:GntR family transcriptional regulator [Hydrogenophaga sp.]MCW5654380.1 FadR family transcriptional regulator [Hydrogenophaga sp.]